MNAKALSTSVDFEEVGDVLEGFEIAGDQLARINCRVERLLADDDVLREVRNLMGVPQKVVASELDVTASAIVELESRSLEAVQLGTLRRYLDALGLKIKVTVEPASRVRSTSGESDRLRGRPRRSASAGSRGYRSRGRCWCCCG